ncbi:MAG: TraR/DksA C4-type zinc finger protein [Candidatus Cloacimonetes bacterium]|nr:TraR/DksA C4-type zinc finger protein [Candidatus Cloacimonadota bacterium]
MATKELKPSALKEYENLLLEERKQVQEIIRSIDESQKRGIRTGSGDLSAYAMHQADMGSDTNSAERGVFMLEREIGKLKLINAALGRIYDKTYGICEICGEYIQKKRLNIVPYARYCIECKSKEEQKLRRRRRRRR